MSAAGWPFPPERAPVVTRGAATDTASLLEVGRLNCASGYNGWHYRLQRDHAGRPFVISDGRLLVLAWHPSDAHGPRLLYAPPADLEAAQP